MKKMFKNTFSSNGFYSHTFSSILFTISPASTELYNLLCTPLSCLNYGCIDLLLRIISIKEIHYCCINLYFADKNHRFGDLLVDFFICFRPQSEIWFLLSLTISLMLLINFLMHEVTILYIPQVHWGLLVCLIYNISQKIIFKIMPNWLNLFFNIILLCLCRMLPCLPQVFF